MTPPRSRPRRGPRRAMYARKLEEAERLFGDLREMSDKGIPIIVEGREDEKALRSLNVTERSTVSRLGESPGLGSVNKSSGRKISFYCLIFTEEEKRCDCGLIESLP